MKKTKAASRLIIHRACIPRLLWTGLVVFIAVFLGLALFGSCGLETFIYLEPVDIVDNPNASIATVTLPGQPAMEFQNYIIYYRIYLSDANMDIIADTEGQRSQINATLATHYRELYSYTLDDYVPSSSLNSVFLTRGYRLLDLDGVELSSELGSTGSGRIELNFASTPANPFPRMTIVFGSASGPFNLYRDTSMNLNRYHFIYDPELEVINETYNADVQPKTSEFPTLNAYVSMYIVASGIDSNFSSVYSRPKHIGIFLLPRVQ